MTFACNLMARTLMSSTILVNEPFLQSHQHQWLTLVIRVVHDRVDDDIKKFLSTLERLYFLQVLYKKCCGDGTIGGSVAWFQHLS